MNPPLSNWTEIATATTAIIAIFLSVFSLYYARESLKLARAQDRRREPKLSVNYIEGRYSTDPTTNARIYRLQISIGNPSDSDNAVARAEFRLTYRLADGTEMTARLQPGIGQGDGGLRLPMRIGAHETLAGWCEFPVTSAIVEGNRIEGYELELTDTHDQMVSVTPLLLSEHHNAV